MYQYLHVFLVLKIEKKVSENLAMILHQSEMLLAYYGGTLNCPLEPVLVIPDLVRTVPLMSVLSVVQLKIEETSRRLRSGDLGIPGQEDRLDIFSN